MAINSIGVDEKKNDSQLEEIINGVFSCAFAKVETLTNDPIQLKILALEQLNVLSNIEDLYQRPRYSIGSLSPMQSLNWFIQLGFITIACVCKNEEFRNVAFLKWMDTTKDAVVEAARLQGIKYKDKTRNVWEEIKVGDIIEVSKTIMMKYNIKIYDIDVSRFMNDKKIMDQNFIPPNAVNTLQETEKYNYVVREFKKMFQSVQFDAQSLIHSNVEFTNLQNKM